jgi:hypothetical protein
VPQADRFTDRACEQSLSQAADTSRNRRGFQAVRFILSLLLFSAAASKLYGLGLEPLQATPFFSSARSEVAVIELEIILGLWLLSGWAVRAAWVAGLMFFCSLASVSLYLALTGQRSCGCFGPVEVHPWLTFALDVAAVAALIIWRPSLAADMQVGTLLPGLLKIGAGALVLLVLIAGAFLLLFDNPVDALAKLRGESITVEPVASDIGEGSVGEERVFRLQLSNRSNRGIRIVGGTSNCSCIATESLPITLLKGESKSINVKVKFSGSVGRFQHRFVLLTDDELQPVVIAQFAGRVIAVTH